MRISSVTLARILEAAAGRPREEACGLLLGEGDRIDAATVARNVADRPAERFEIDPAALLAAHRAARGGGARVVGCWHSHPSGEAAPSACDIAMAEAGQLWLIVAGGEVRAWRMGDAPVELSLQSSPARGGGPPQAVEGSRG